MPAGRSLQVGACIQWKDRVKTKLLLPILLLAFAHPSAAAGQVSVKELEQRLAHATSDKSTAQKISELQLTERLSTGRLRLLTAALPGDKSKLALLALADASAFLDLPSSDISQVAAPDAATQQALLAKAADYLRKTMPSLPDFFATHRTLEFADGPLKASASSSAKPWDTRLHLAAESSATVRFLAGKEEVAAVRPGGKSAAANGKQLEVQGVFGPILIVALDDVLASQPFWSHWEKGTDGSIAVFRYNVPTQKSHFSVPVPGDFDVASPLRAYQGEIAFDPASGAILRLTLRAITQPDGPVKQADILVEYGPVAIAGQTWICPLRSVALASVRNLDMMHDLYKFSQTSSPQFQVKMNDVSYAQYHLFRTRMRLLPGDSAGDDAVPTVEPPHRSSSAAPPRQ
jgi:hypothetical protein